MATVTNSRRRGERSSGSKKVAASKPKLRQTSVANRGVQSGTPKPGTYTSNNTMAKNPTPTNKRGGAQRKTGGKAGGRAGKPSGPVAGTKDKTVRVPSSWKAQTVDPTNQRGGNQRPTGGLAGGRAGRPSSNIARPPAKPASTPKPSGNFKAPSIPKGAVKQATKGTSALSKAGRFVGRAGAVLTGAELFKQGQSGSELDQLTRAIGGKGSNPNTDIGKRAGDAIKTALTQKSKYGPRFKKSGSQPAAKPAAKSQMGPMPALKGGFVNGKLQMTQVAKPKAKPAAKPVAPKAATAPARSSAPSRSSAPGRSTTSARTTASRPAAKPAAKPKAPASMATESSLSASDIMKSYGMRVNQTFSAQSPSTPKKRESLKDQTASIKKMIEESKKRQGKG